MKPETKKLVKYIKQSLKEEGFKLVLHKSKRIRVDTGIYTSGLFSEDDFMLSVAIKKNETLWVQTLVHEFGHFLQYKKNKKVWTDCYRFKDNHFTLFDNWLMGKRVNNIETVLKEIKKLEWDCEKNALMFIKEFNLKIDLKSYIQKANSYIAFYDHIKISRKWYKSQAPYEIKNLYEKMPAKLKLNYSKAELNLYKKYF